MRVSLGRVAAVGVVLGLVASPAAAQIFNHPVYFSPNHGTGVTIAFDAGFGLNEDAEVTTGETPIALGGHVTLGLPVVTITAGASSVDPGGTGSSSEIGFGGNVALTLFKAPATPVVVSLQGGVGYIKFGDDPNTVTTLDIPIGVGLAIDVPTTGVSVEPWVAPRVHIQNVDAAVMGLSASATEVGFGISGGLNVGLPVGVGLHAAIDWQTIGDVSISPLRAGVGLHYTFTVPSLGVGKGVLGN